MIATHTCHQHKFIVKIESVLGICSNYVFIWSFYKIRHQGPALIKAVMIERQTGRNAVTRSELGLKHQLCIGIIIVHVISLQTIQ